MIGRSNPALMAISFPDDECPEIPTPGYLMKLVWAVSDFR